MVVISGEPPTVIETVLLCECLQVPAMCSVIGHLDRQSVCAAVEVLLLRAPSNRIFVQLLNCHLTHSPTEGKSDKCRVLAHSCGHVRAAATKNGPFR